MVRYRASLASALVSVVGLGATAHAAEPSRFEPTACSELPDVADVLPRLRCGLVRVPRDHADPGGPRLALAVVVVASAERPAAPDPVLYISGGPGSPLTIYAGHQARHPYAPARDLVLVDQRGTGRSEPRLCPDLQDSLVDAMLAVVTEPTASAIAASRAAHAACRDSVTSRGIDPDTFGTVTTVEDLDWVRRALGIERWNIVGESYGTTVAMTWLARHPETVRSAVLDSLNPPDAFFETAWSGRVRRARDAFFAACEADPACARSFPDLAGSYLWTAARLAREPASLSLRTSAGTSDGRVRLTPSLFEEIVGRLVYYPATRAALPRVISATRGGDLGPISRALTGLLAGARQTGNEAAFVAVECRDRAGWREPITSDASPLDIALLPPGICADWSSLGPEPEVPRDTTVPTLVLAGEFDPNIGPEESRRVASLIGSHARWVEFAGTGHNVRAFSPCATAVVAAFIASPDRSPDTACATEARTLP